MSSTCIDYHITDSASFPFLETLSSPFQSIVGRADADYSLLSYFSCHFLLSLIHGHAHPRYHDFTYKCGMALEHRPLMDAALTCAAVSPARKVSMDPNAQSRVRKKDSCLLFSRSPSSKCCGNCKACCVTFHLAQKTVATKSRRECQVDWS